LIKDKRRWIPAFAGMTEKMREYQDVRAAASPPAFAGMTEKMREYQDVRAAARRPLSR